MDNEGATTTSTIVTFNVNSVIDNQAPTASIISPSFGSEFTEGTTVTVEADAVDADGSIAKLEFYLNGSFYAEDLTAPYSMNFEGLTIGTHEVSVKSIDNDGVASLAVGTSFTINEQVTNGGCSESQYIEGNVYLAGDNIQNVSNLYSCKVGGWCSGAAWAYEPGVGMYWNEAWNLVRACSEVAQPSDIDAQISQSTLSTEIVIETEKSQTVEVRVFSSIGKLVFQDQFSVENIYRYVLNLNSLNSGIYIVQLKGNSNKVQSVIIK